MSCVELANIAHTAFSAEVLDLLNTISPGQSKSDWQKFGGLAVRQVVQFNGDVKVLEALMEHPDIDVNACDEFGRTPLHLAVIRDAAEMVEILLRRKDLHVNACAFFDMTPLHLAARLGCTEVLPRLLSDRRVRLDVRTIHEQTALHLLVQGADAKSHLSKHSSLQERSKALVMLVRALKERNMLAILSDCDSVGRLALHYVAENGHMELMESTMLNATDIDALDHRGFSPLHLAVRAGQKDVVASFLQVPSVNAKIGTLEALFDMHVNWTVNSFDDARKCQKLSLIPVVEPPLETSHNLTPLHFAAKDGNIIIVGAILGWHGMDGQGIDVDARDSKGFSALHYAAHEGYVEVVKILLSHQLWPLINCMDSEGVTSPLQHAVNRGHVAIVKELWNVVDQNMPQREWLNLITVLLDCATNESQEVASLLLEKLKNSVEIAEYLDPRPGQNLAHWVARKVKDSNNRLLTHILKWEPSFINAKDTKLERTPLHMAVIHKNLNAVKALCLGNGCEVVQCSAEDLSSNRPLDLATYLQQSDICDVLLKRRDVKSMVDRENELRKTYVDASNAVLVGGALLATITYVGWLQPPLGYTTDYNIPEPFPAPPGAHPNYVSLDSRTTSFFKLNTIAFVCSIGSVLVGLATVLPSTVVWTLLPPLQLARFLLDIACSFLIAAASCAVVAFAFAGWAVLPPDSKYRHTLLQVVFYSSLALVYIILICFMSAFWEEVKYWRIYISSKPQLPRHVFLRLTLGPFLPTSWTSRPFDPGF